MKSAVLIGLLIIVVLVSASVYYKPQIKHWYQGTLIKLLVLSGVSEGDIYFSTKKPTEDWYVWRVNVIKRKVGEPWPVPLVKYNDKDTY